MLERDLVIKNALGLHARAAAKLVRLAHKFHSGITLKRFDTNVSADGKDILSVLQLAAGYGVKLTVVVDGDDDHDAMEAIIKLFLDGFGELD